MTQRKRYSAEFKREAIGRANEEGVTDVLVAEELGINAQQLRRWRETIRRDGEKAFPGEGNAKDQEMMQLKRKLAKPSRHVSTIELSADLGIRNHATPIATNHTIKPIKANWAIT